MHGLSSPATGIHSEIVDQPARAQELVPAWDALFERCPRAAMPLSPAWVLTWWRVYGNHYGRAPCGLRLITTWRGKDLIGVLPLYLRKRAAPGLPSPRQLYLVSSGEAEFEESCAEYLDLLCRDEDAADCLAATSEALAQSRWQRLMLRLVDARSPLAGLPQALADGADVDVHEAGICPVADLDAGFEAYLGRLSASARYRMRRALREADDERVRFAVAGESDATAMFDALGELHQRHWTSVGSPGCFAAPRWVAFHRALIGQLLPRGRAVLASLHVDEIPVAVIYGFLVHGTFHYYQTGVSRADIPGVRSPGILANLLLMRHLAAIGVARYDFLRGRSRYKRELSTHEGRLLNIEAWRRTTPARTWRTLHPLWMRALRKFGVDVPPM